jgi:hypothetical protein
MALNKIKLGKYIQLFSEQCNIPNLEKDDVSGINREKEFFISRLNSALETLPKKSNALIGGGGGNELFDSIKLLLDKKQITCKNIEFNVGRQGLIILANQFFAKY